MATGAPQPMRARLDKRSSKRAVGVVMTLGYDRLYNRCTHADPLFAVGRLAGRPGPRRRRSPVRDVRRPHAGRRSLARAPPSVPAGPPASGGSANARTSRPPETAPPAAAAAARPLRPRRGARGHQEEARRSHPDGARGDQGPPRRDVGGAETRRARQAPAGPGRPDPGAADLRLRGSRGEAPLRRAHAVAPRPDARAAPQGHAAGPPGDDARGSAAPARDAPGPEPDAPPAGGGPGARLPGVQGQVGPVLPRRREPRRAARSARSRDRADAVAPREHVARPARRASRDDALALHAGRAPRGRAGPARRPPRGAPAARRAAPPLRVRRRRGADAPRRDEAHGGASADGPARAPAAPGAEPRGYREDRPRPGGEASGRGGSSGPREAPRDREEARGGGLPRAPR